MEELELDGVSSIEASSIIFNPIVELHIGLDTLGEDALFNDFNGTNNISKEVNEILSVDVLLDFSNSHEKSVGGHVDAFKTVVHDLVFGLNIHRDIVDEGTVKFSDLRVVNLSGQSENS